MIRSCLIKEVEYKCVFCLFLLISLKNLLNLLCFNVVKQLDKKTFKQSEL